MRLSPLSNAPCEAEATVRLTPSANHPTSPALDASPSTVSATNERASQTTPPPKTARMPVPQNKARRTAAIAAASLSPAASAIWRVPALPKPKPATEATVDIILPYSPISPIPTGPSNTATILMRNRPIRILIIEAPPIMEELRRIWRWEVFSVTGVARELPAGAL